MTNPLRDATDRRLPRVPGPCALVMFGVTGDLARKKLLPAIYDLANRGLLPPGFALVGYGRRNWDDGQFTEYVRESVVANARTPYRDEVFSPLADGMRFVFGAFDSDEGFKNLHETLREVDERQGTGGNHAYYLSIPPAGFDAVIEQLRRHHLVDKSATTPWNRVVIEKPFGHDLASARELEKRVSGVFNSNEVFRIDHYLGKETVQNLLAMRFANQLFEPIWNRNYVSHVQITMAEEIGIGGRAGYYDGIGAARDVIQNHLLQLLALVAMEEPSSFDPGNLRAEKEKVLAAARAPRDLASHTARGQYTGGWAGGQCVRGYLQEDGIPDDSQTETYAAFRVDIDNRRWAGVPFYLRSAKRMPRRVTEVALLMQPAPHLPFHLNDTEQLGANALVLRIQPDEGVTLRFGAKVPATQMEIRDVTMDFNYGTSFAESSPEAYERLIWDVMLGDPPLFPQHTEVELSWKILDPILEHWAAKNQQPEGYAAGTWGPPSGKAMLARDGFVWRRP